MIKRNIAFLIDTLLSGGAERVICNLCNYFSNNQYKVSLLVVSQSNCDSFYPLDKKVKIIPLQENINKKKITKLHKITLIKKVFKERKIEIAVSFLPQINIYTFFATIFTRVKHIVSLRSDPHSDLKDNFRRLLRKLAFKYADGCVFQTEDAMKYFDNVKIKNKCVIANPIANFKYYIDTEKSSLSIVSVGRFHPTKNLTLLIDAFSKFVKIHKDYMLYLYGDGSEADSLKKLTIEKKISERVVFRGNVKDWFKDSPKPFKMFILTSNFEGMPNALMEAMAIGLPCISTDCPIGGPRSLIRNNENGILIPPNDIDSLVKAMNRLADSKELCQKFNAFNRNFNDKYSLEKIGIKWQNFIESVCK